MTRKEILTKLIKYYNKHIKIFKNLSRNYNPYLLNNGIDYGICWAAFTVFHVKNLFSYKWVRKYSKEDGYWCKKPVDAPTKKKKIELLQYRVDIMKKELKTCK